MTVRRALAVALLVPALVLQLTGAVRLRPKPKSASVSTVAKDLPAASPESVGFSAERLKRVETMMEQFVDSKQLPGGITMLARHGKVVEFKAYGNKDIASGTPMETDSIFRIFSMTKPITGVAMMMLYEEGKWRPEDPISKFVPEFKDLKVFKGLDAAGNMIVEAPEHAPTMGELMSHTAGFTYGLFGGTPVDRLYMQKGVLGGKTLQEMVETLAAIPLLYQPGSQWVYSVSVDIQGHIIEKITGQTLGQFFKERIFEPLGMRDTGFFVPEDKWSRFVTMYNMDPKGELVPATFGGDYKSEPAAPSGGGGLVSTAHDYMLFAQMLAHNGQLGGARLLSPSSVKLMTSNHLPPKLLTGQFFIGTQRMRPGFGFGYDFAVFYDPVEAGSTSGKGTYLWEGAAGTWFWVDPTNDVVFVGMIQRLLDTRSPDLHHLSRVATFQALVDPDK